MLSLGQDTIYMGTAQPSGGGSGGSITVDSAFSTTSTNPVQNKVITLAINDITGLIPSSASSSNQLTDKNFVNSSISSNTANFIGTFSDVATLEAYSGTVTNNDYAFVVNHVVTDNGNDWATFAALDAYDKTLLTNWDYAWVINGSNFDIYRFDIINQTWDLRVSNIQKSSVTLNTTYNRYKATVSSSTVSWSYEYTLNNSSFTAAQWAAINSGATNANIGQISTNTTNIGNLQAQAGNAVLTTTAQTLSGAINELNAAGFLTTSDVDASTITTNSSNKLQTVGIINQNTESGAVSPLKLWNGTEAEWETGGSVATPLYAWDNGTVIGPLLSRYVYTLNETPQVGDKVYKADGTQTTFPITEVGSNYIKFKITISTFNCHRDSTSDTSFITTSSVGEAYPDWLCFINGVGIKIGTTTIATANTVDQVYNASSTNAQSGVAVASAISDTLGTIETALSEV